MTTFTEPEFTPCSSIKFLCSLPFDDGETIAKMSAATLGEQEMLLLATSRGRVFLLQVTGAQITIAGPLEFHPAP